MCGWDKNEGQEIFRFWRGNGRDLNTFLGAWPWLGRWIRLQCSKLGRRKRIEDEMTYDVAGESTVHGSTWDGFGPSGMIPRMILRIIQ